MYNTKQQENTLNWRSLLDYLRLRFYLWRHGLELISLSAYNPWKLNSEERRFRKAKNQQQR